MAISCSRNHRNGELYSLIEKCCYFWIQKSSSTNISCQFICYWTPCTCKTFIQFQEFIIKSIVQLWNDDSTWSFNGILIAPFMGCIVQRYGYMIAFFSFLNNRFSWFLHRHICLLYCFYDVGCGSAHLATQWIRGKNRLKRKMAARLQQSEHPQS